MHPLIEAEARPQFLINKPEQGVFAAMRAGGGSAAVVGRELVAQHQDAGEIAALTLDDIDWRAGELCIRGKGGRVDRTQNGSDMYLFAAGGTVLGLGT